MRVAALPVRPVCPSPCQRHTSARCSIAAALQALPPGSLAPSLTVPLLSSHPCAVLRNMSNGYKHQRQLQDEDDGSRWRAPPVERPAVRRGSDAGEGAAAGGGGGGGGDERSVVELETDADGMDDGYR